jgi:hypothetical protein
VKHNNIVAIEEETMILGAIFSSASIEFDMPDVETFMEEGDSSQPLDMKEDDTINDTCLVPLRTLIDINTVFTGDIPTTGAVSLTVTVESSEEKVRKRKMKGSYRRYTAHQIEQLFDYVFEQGKTTKEVAFLTGINIRTAQDHHKPYNDDEERRLPVCGRNSGAGHKAKLIQTHSQFLIVSTSRLISAHRPVSALGRMHSFSGGFALQRLLAFEQARL